MNMMTEEKSYIEALGYTLQHEVPLEGLTNADLNRWEAQELIGEINGDEHTIKLYRKYKG